MSQPQRKDPLLVTSPRRRGLEGASSRGFAWAVSLSVLVHVLLTPAAGVLGLLSWLLVSQPDAEEPAVEPLRSIPITWLGEIPQAAPEPEPPPAEPARVPPAEATVAGPRDEPAPPEPTPPKPRQAKPKPEPATPPEKESNAAHPEVAHPLAASAVHSEVVDDNANVNLLLLSDRIREHPLGERIGRLMTIFPQWRSFLGSTSVDPIRDVDRILLVGPQFRRSAEVVAILRHRLEPAVLRQAVDTLVQRKPKGHWLEGAPVPAALAHADRAQRLFAFTAPDIVVVAPPHLKAQLLSTPITSLPDPEGEQALIVHLKTPWRALIGLPFELPRSIAWLRLDVTPLADGGALLRVLAEDESADLARRHARELTRAVNTLTNPSLGSLGALLGVRTISFVDEIQLSARDAAISGSVAIRPQQMRRLLAYAEEFVLDWTGQPRTRLVPTRQDGSAPSPTPGIGAPPADAEPPVGRRALPPPAATPRR